MELGIDKNNLFTASFQTGENYSGKTFLTSRRDYKTSITIYVMIDSLEILEPAIFLLSESAVNTISNISFTLKNKEELKHKALINAVNNAKMKAHAISTELGIALGQIQRFEESGVSTRSDVSFMAFDAPPRRQKVIAQEQTFFAKPIKITARVRIYYAIVID